MDTELDEQLEAYKQSLTAKERVVLQIAVEDLESSFDLAKSIGFKCWLDQRRREEEADDDDDDDEQAQ